MSDLYAEEHRTLQDRFDTRALADRLEQLILKDRLDENDTRFVRSQALFFLATVDQHGRPTVSYKGGQRGFVAVLDDQTLAFPNYDGNGMYLSMGNIAGRAEVGMLFIDFTNPARLRVQGTASVAHDDPLLGDYPGAELIVRVAVRQVWTNCPRYIHPHQPAAVSHNVPQATGTAPLAAWKRLEVMQDALPARDRERVAAAGGTIGIEHYLDELSNGRP